MRRYWISTFEGWERGASIGVQSASRPPQTFEVDKGIEYKLKHTN